jgi:hypothetical protein
MNDQVRLDSICNRLRTKWMNLEQKDYSFASDPVLLLVGFSGSTPPPCLARNTRALTERPGLVFA